MEIDFKDASMFNGHIHQSMTSFQILIITK